MKNSQLKKINDILDNAKIAFSDDYLCKRAQVKEEKLNNLSKINLRSAIFNNKKEEKLEEKVVEKIDNSKVDYLSNFDYFELEKYVLKCEKCPASSIRKNIIFGKGSKSPDLMIIGEGPGKDEDANNDIFVGASGQYLKTWLKAIKINMDNDVYLSNIVKCFSNANPTDEIVSSCLPYLQRQIEIINPKVILILGKIAANNLLNKDLAMKDLRGNIYSYKRIPCVVTYHPAAVLRNPDWRRPVWEDLKKVNKLISL